MAKKKGMGEFMKWLFSTKKAGDYGKDPEDPNNLGKTQGGASDAKRDAIKELEKEYAK